MSGLQDLLGLPEPKRATSSEQAERFGREFRAKMAELNQKLQVVAAQASKDDYQPLEAQKTRLYEAYQKGSAQVDPADPAKAEPAIERVMAAVASVDGKAAEVSTAAVASRDEWRRREGDLDDAMLQIGELEEAEHPKSPALRKLGDAIRSRATDRKYEESLTVFDQLRAKLDEFYTDYQRQAESNGKGEGELLSAPERDSMWKELEEIERRLERVIAEHGIAI